MKLRCFVLISIVLTFCFCCSLGYCLPPDMPLITTRHLFDIEADFLHPSDVSVGKNSRIYVLDGINSRVKVFNADGALLYSFGSAGNGKGEFNKPLGIDIDTDGYVYIADSGNRRIQIFDAGGSFVSAFHVKTNTCLKPPDPTDIAVDEATNRCYVVDNNNHNILVYSMDGSRLLDQWGQSGEKPGEFRFPFLAAMDSLSTLYVVDVLNTRVQAISSEGRTMAYIGKWGVDRGQFYRPKGVAVDIKNRIYISDSYLGVVQVFKRYRKFTGVLGNQNGQILKLQSPTGIYVDDDIRIYIVEMLENKVSVFQIMDQ